MAQHLSSHSNPVIGCGTRQPAGVVAAACRRGRPCSSTPDTNLLLYPCRVVRTHRSRCHLWSLHSSQMAGLLVGWIMLGHRGWLTFCISDGLPTQYSRSMDSQRKVSGVEGRHRRDAQSSVGGHRIWQQFLFCPCAWNS